MGITLYWVVREGLPGKVTFEQRDLEKVRKLVIWKTEVRVSQSGGRASAKVLRQTGLVKSRNS